MIILRTDYLIIISFTGVQNIKKGKMDKGALSNQ